MKFIDLTDGREYTLADLKRDWIRFREEGPWNHAADFHTELFEILMATVNGRNELDIIGMTPREIDRLIQRLRRTL